MTPAAAATSHSAQKTTAADWIATASDDEDVNAYYAGTRQRGGRKKRKKNNKEASQVIQHDWDDIYDPTRPNHYEEYKYSEEKIREVREWKDLLYRHRMRRQSSDSDSDSDRSRGQERNSKSISSVVASAKISETFASPPSMSFAPPAQFESPSNLVKPDDDSDEHEYVPPPPAMLPDDLTGDDAFARRMRMSGLQNVPAPPSPPPPPPPDMPKPTIGQIARAPVRYNLPLPDPELPSNEAELQEMEVDNPPEEAPKSLRPGQAKFAERLMAKYGWSKGQGLGKEQTGVTTALYAKVEKRKKKSDAEGGGFATPAPIGRILGGKQSEAGKAAEEGRFGAMSEVVRLQGMLKGMDLQAEMFSDQGGLMQEIGEECSEKYGNVERVYIHSDTDDENGALVFVRFTSQLSALRAVNALEGRVFNGNEIKARFWQREKFEKGQYE